MATKTRSRPQFVEITRELGDKIEVMRYHHKDNPEGFQRPLNTMKATYAADRLSGGLTNCPPIMLGRIGSRIICVDGQHRLQAWKLRKFPLFAVIYEYQSIEAMSRDFDNINTYMAKVTLNHRLAVSPNPYPKRCRKTALELGVSARDVHYTLMGLSEHGAGFYQQHIPEATWKIGERILKRWTSDPRWAKKDQVYHKRGILRVVGIMCRKAKAVDTVVSKMQEMNYEDGQPISMIQGTGSTEAKDMREYFIRHLMKAGVKEEWPKA